MNGKQSEAEDEGTDRGVLYGFLIGVGIELMGAVAFWWLWPEAFFFIGVAQLAYMLPVLGLARFMELRGSIVKGLILCSAIVFLLNALCFGVVVVSMTFTGPWGG